MNVCVGLNSFFFCFFFACFYCLSMTSCRHLCFYCQTMTELKMIRDCDTLDCRGLAVLHALCGRLHIICSGRHSDCHSRLMCCCSYSDWFIMVDIVSHRNRTLQTTSTPSCIKCPTRAELQLQSLCLSSLMPRRFCCLQVLLKMR